MRAESNGNLLGPAQIRDLAAELEVSPTKRLGQNFVHDHGTVRRIASLAQVGPDDLVMEVGPGLGSLTLALLETGARVVAVEIDPRLAGRLPTTVDQMSVRWGERLVVVGRDALLLHAGDLPAECVNPTALVANLPYNVSVPIILTLLARFESIRSVTVMVQKEVAERLTAGPGSRTYGAPSVKLAWYGAARYAGTVGRKVFWPEPNVDSALVTVPIEPPRGAAELRDATFAVVDAAFGQRRKMLRATLKSLWGDGDVLTQALGSAGLEGTERPEVLGIDAFVALTKGALGAGWLRVGAEG